MNSYRLSVPVDEENNPCSGFDTKPDQHSFYPLELLFVYYNGRFCHEIFLSLYLREANGGQCCESARPRLSYKSNITVVLLLSVFLCLAKLNIFRSIWVKP